ncbi:Glutamate--tRNA ligase 2 [Mesotoga infera]|jgi:nondiscriminating glutamyl-tRNA synthetase|uniref:Glutamate--tRNA ligase n=2 Tax=Mesotoga infera TaxID=1236046 RepID=A0A7Z7PPL4_9BACT|nr:glutamate--tRNA ligase [Mesotoga infera]SSC13189.1 Glutamate--tRNA ligase 2 [Mesotoga infera]HNS66188.1 glutamate--tRNA ligase [Mesotoga infera]HON27760.1 glutamate--tRNA ligase [Mesotoga infera]HRR43294.1 glutamate--tRNA ligase [Mesotoga sp.]
MMNMIRVRFAPSPTGYLHVGGARTALFNYLFAKHYDGKFVLRIEDTDVSRSTKEYEEQLMESLLWMGITWDEGPDVGGETGPYRQTERTDIYVKMVEELINSGKAYRVYAYPEEIETLHDDLLSQGKPPHYDQQMLEKFNTSERKKEFEDKGLNPVVFFKMPRKEYRLVDLIKGEVIFKEGSIGDFVILRSNNQPIYNFAVVVDDILMEITHVIRGDDHLSNTLRQLALYEAFEAPIPFFAHVSMILGPDGKKLSKRHGDTSVEQFRDKGFLPEAFFNFLTLLGWSHPEGKEILSYGEIIESFTIDRVNTSAAIFDEAKARWMNGVYIRETDLDRITDLTIPFLVRAGLITLEEANANRKWLKRAIDSVRKGVELLQEIPEKMKLYFEEIQVKPLRPENEEQRKVFRSLEAFKDRIEYLNSWSNEEIVSTIKEILKEIKPDRKAFYMSLRHVLTASEEGPELVDVVFLLGRNKTLHRLQQALRLP